MTGYGKAKINLENKNFTIEVKSLNSKYIDTNIKMSSIYKDKEIKLRHLISDKLQRGKIELSIWREKSESSNNYILNTEIAKDYFSQIKELNNSLELDIKEIMSSILKMPDVLVKGDEKGDENEWKEIEKGVNSAIENLLQFRLDEGSKLEEDITLRINQLSSLLKEIAPFAKDRVGKIKESLSWNISTFI